MTHRGAPIQPGRILLYRQSSLSNGAQRQLCLRLLALTHEMKRLRDSTGLILSFKLLISLWSVQDCYQLASFPDLLRLQRENRNTPEIWQQMFCQHDRVTD